MTTQVPPTMPGIPGVPGIPVTNNLIPAPTGGGMATEPETINWAQWLEESKITEQSMPAADYDAQIVAAEPDRAGNGKPMFKLTWQIISGPYAGRRLTRNLVVSHGNNKAMRVFFRQMKALGFEDQYWLSNPLPGQVADAMLNRMARIQVTQREWPKNSGVIDNEVGFIREAISSPMQPGVMPQMINQAGYPAAPAMPQTFAAPPPPQAPQNVAPQQAQPQMPGIQQAPPLAPQQAPIPQQLAQPAATYDVQAAAQGQQPWGQQPSQNGPEQAPPIPPTWQQPQAAPQQPPTVVGKVNEGGWEGPPQAPQTVPFEQMLRPPEQATAPPQAAPQPQPVAQPQQPAEAQQPTAEEIAAFQQFMAQQQPAQPPAPPAPPVPSQF